MRDAHQWSHKRLIAPSLRAFCRVLDYRVGQVGSARRAVLISSNNRKRAVRIREVIATGGIAILHGSDEENSIVNEQAEFHGCHRHSKWMDPATGSVALWREERPEAAERVDAQAIVTAYNEADIIRPSIRRLLDQNLRVHVIDNWSTDGTIDILQDLACPELSVERYPAEGPSEYYEWGRLLRRVAAVAARSSAQWIIHHDVDESRSSPWPGIALPVALAHVQACGFNAIDHSVFEFHPVDDGFVAGTDFESYFRYFAPPRASANHVQVKAWRNLAPVDLHSSGGHDVQFPGRAVFPYNFLLKHYPIRGQRHGEQKVLQDRRPRFSQQEKAKRWHSHYDHVREDFNFLKNPNDLQLFSEVTPFDRLIERLSGVGLSSSTPTHHNRLAARLASVGLLDVIHRARSRFRKMMPLIRR